MSECLRGADSAAGAGSDAKDAEQDQDKANFFCVDEWLMQDRRRQNRNRQRHHPGKESSRMRRRSEQKASIREQDGGTAAEHDRHQSDPTEAFECETLTEDIRQQEQTGHTETKRSDVPGREACSQAEASHHNPSGPDADRREAVGRTTNVFCRSSPTDGQIRHNRLPSKNGYS